MRCHRVILRCIKNYLSMWPLTVGWKRRSVDILVAVAPLRVTLLVHKNVMKLVKALWQTLSSLPPIAKHAERKYYVSAKDFEYLYSHPSPSSLVVSMANE